MQRKPHASSVERFFGSGSPGEVAEIPRGEELVCPSCGRQCNVMAKGNAPPQAWALVMICTQCGGIGMFELGHLRECTPAELRRVQQSPSWPMMARMIAEIRRGKPQPPELEA